VAHHLATDQSGRARKANVHRRHVDIPNRTHL
jgi:hypothetical protein